METYYTSMQIPLELIDKLEDNYSRYWWSRNEEEEFNKIFYNPFKNLIFSLTEHI